MKTIEINGTTINKHEQPAISVPEMVGRTADAMLNGLWTDRNAAVQLILLAMDAALFLGRNDTRFAMLGSKLGDIALDALRLGPPVLDDPFEDRFFD